MSAEVLFLGTGASMGIPVIGCSCTVCQSSSSFNKRMRPSVLLIVDEKHYLIDAGPDFRMQALQHGLTKIDGVIFTHSHYDHIGGLDELRIFYFREKKPLPCLTSQETLEEIRARYHYIMPSMRQDQKYDMKFVFQVLEDNEGNVQFQGLDMQYFSYFQKGMKVTGIRLKDFAYVVDIFDYRDTIFTGLKGVETLIIDGMTWERTTAHLGIFEVIQFVKKIGCGRVYLTHIAHEIDHESTNLKLPYGMELAYDGLKLTLW